MSYPNEHNIAPCGCEMTIIHGEVWEFNPCPKHERFKKK
jgi:hypothetical protein